MGLDAITFVKVAVRAGIAKVIEAGLATERLGHNVVDMKRLRRDDLWCVAILTTIAGTRRDSTRQLPGDIGHKLVPDQQLLDWRRTRAVRRTAVLRRARLIRPEASTRSGRVARRRASVF